MLQAEYGVHVYAWDESKRTALNIVRSFCDGDGLHVPLVLASNCGDVLCAAAVSAVDKGMSDTAMHILARLCLPPVLEPESPISGTATPTIASRSVLGTPSPPVKSSAVHPASTVPLRSLVPAAPSVW